MRRSPNRILVYVGTTPRPADFQALRVRGSASPEDLARALSGEVGVVNKQVGVGTALVNDGELSKSNFTTTCATGSARIASEELWR